MDIHRCNEQLKSSEASKTGEKPAVLHLCVWSLYALRLYMMTCRVCETTRVCK